MNKIRRHSFSMIVMGCMSLISFFLLGCSGEDDTTDVVIEKLVSANTRFGFKLLTEVYEQDAGKNIFISPLSISIALAMTYNGAAGETQQAMAETLELGEMNLQEVNQANAELRADLENLDPKVEFTIANSLWARKGREFNPDFLERNRQFFGAEITMLDFNDSKAIEIINQWVDKNTKGKIEKIVEQIDPLTVMFLINAIYFKGIWKVKFDKSKTVDGIFYLLDGTQKQTPMMSRAGGYSYYQGENFQAVKLLYGEGRVSMYIFLPDRGSNLNEFLRKLNAENWANWMPQFSEVEDDSEIMMPRFKLECEVFLNDALKALGMEVAFDSRANFYGMAPGLFVSEVKHKAFVEVNEEGTEAAAVTAVKMGELAVPRTVVVDRPFFFAIRDDKTGTVLFMGIVIEPL